MRFLCLALLFCCIAIHAGAQDALPPAPADGIHDDTRALSDDSRQQLVEEIRTFRAHQGMDAWFYATTFLTDSQSPRNRARLLRVAWSGERPAFLLLYDRSKNEEMVSFSPLLWKALPTAELFRIRETVREKMADSSKQPEQRLRESMHELLTGLSHLQAAETRATNTYTHDWQRMLKGYGIALLAGAVIAGIAGVLVRRRDQKAAHVCFMPAIHVPSRLGAAHGGGTCVSWAERN